MKMTNRVSLGFTKLNVDSLLLFATGVRTKLYAKAEFNEPPVTELELTSATTALSDAKVAQASGGKAATATKNACQEVVIDLLKKLAYYVQIACDNDLALLLESGFDAMNTNRAQTPLPKPTIIRIAPGMSGEALVTVAAIPNAKSYEVQVAEVNGDNTPGPFRLAMVRTGSRNIPVAELMPGKLCVFQVRAIGGQTGFSDWSDAVVQRAA